MHGEFCSPSDVPLDMFENQSDGHKNDTLMRAVDSINPSGQGREMGSMLGNTFCWTELFKARFKMKAGIGCQLSERS